LLSGENATSAVPEMTAMRRSSVPVARSQMRAVPSRLEVAIDRPSGEKSIPVIQLRCPEKIRIVWPVATSHSRAVVASSTGRRG